METFNTHIEVRFGWLDCLRILCGRAAHLHVRVEADIPPYAGPCRADTAVFVDPVLPRRRLPDLSIGESDESRVARALMASPAPRTPGQAQPPRLSPPNPPTSPNVPGPDPHARTPAQPLPCPTPHPEGRPRPTSPPPRRTRPGRPRRVTPPLPPAPTPLTNRPPRAPRPPQPHGAPASPPSVSRATPPQAAPPPSPVPPSPHGRRRARHRTRFAGSLARTRPRPPGGRDSRAASAAHGGIVPRAGLTRGAWGGRLEAEVVRWSG